MANTLCISSSSVLGSQQHQLSSMCMPSLQQTQNHVPVLHYLSRRRCAVAVQARRQGGWDSSSSRSSSRGSRSSRDGSNMFRFKFNQMDVALAEDQLWQLALPFALLFGFAVFIGE